MTSPKPTSDLTPDDVLLLEEMHIDPDITPKPDVEPKTHLHCGLRGVDQL